MIIQALDQLYQRLSQNSLVPSFGFSRENIDFCLVLNHSGEIVAIDDLRQVVDNKKNKKIPRKLQVPQGEKRSSNINANFMWDKTAYSLGVSHHSKQVTEEHQAFKEKQLKLLQDIDNPHVIVYLNFLHHWNPDNITNPIFDDYRDDIIDSNIVFRVDNDRYYLHDVPVIQEAWLASLNQSENIYYAQCLVSGKEQAIARLHTAIKGVDNAQSSGASLVSFNLNAFESYKKTQGFNAPIGEKIVFNYTTALNYLLRKDSDNFQRIKIGDTTTVFWADASDVKSAEAAENCFGYTLNPTDEEQARKLEPIMLKIAKGEPIRDFFPDIDVNAKLFVLGLSPNASRLSIRFWHYDSFENMTRHLAQHYHDLHIEPVPWKKLPNVHFLALQTAPIRNKKPPEFKDINPLITGNLMWSILTGRRYPENLLAQIIMRMRSDGHINGYRIAIIKAILNRQQRLNNNNQMEIHVSLDIHENNPAYLLGRLFAIYEGIQQKALGHEVGATIRDKYWSSASANPASVFPTIQRNSMNHLSKIRKDTPNLAVFFDKQIGSILENLGTQYPKSFNLNEQGRFAIGYYHQRFTKHIKNKDGQQELNLMATDVNDENNH